MKHKITVVYHRADFDGLFCREIARKFLGDTAEYVGWDHGDKPLALPDGETYILDLPVDRVIGDNFGIGENRVFLGVSDLERIIWIDHHKSAIETHPAAIPGYRIDGVAACRLAWQWFVQGKGGEEGLPARIHFVERQVQEPMAVRLAGWDKRNPDAEVFQFGLRSVDLQPEDWARLLSPNDEAVSFVRELLDDGHKLQRYQQELDARNVMNYGFLVEFEGLKFLAMNTPAKSSLAFFARDVPATGHDALLKFNWTGRQWDVSLYHARHRTDLDLCEIAVRHGGGGHRGACGFRAKELPFLRPGN